MIRHIASFEWRYQLKSPVLWVGSVLFFLFSYGSTVVDEIQIGSRGNVYVNAPLAILQKQAIMSLFFVFVLVAMVANVVIRDDETGFAPILRSTSISKAAYLVGRFVGASAAALLVLASVPLGIAVGSTMPWLDPEKVGAFRILPYLYSIFAFGLPTLLILAAAFFALATATRSMMWTYVGAVAALVGYLVVQGLLRDPRFHTIAALSDPFGLSALSIVTRYWTAAERNTQLPSMTGLLLWNRLIWSGMAGLLFAVAYRLFRFETKGSADLSKKTLGDKEEEAKSAPKAHSADAKPARFPALAQLITLARFDMAFVFRSPAYFVLLAIGLLNSVGALWFTGEFYGSPSYPVTRLMAQALSGAFTIMPIIIAVYYSGELVWRDRDRRMHEIVDATPAPDWTHLVPKIVAITLVLVSTTLVGVLAGVVVQAIKGYTHFELVSYLLWFVWPTAVGAFLLAVLSVFVQVLVPQKFIGWGVMLLYIVSTLVLTTTGFEHNLYQYAGSPAVPLSDMNGMGRFWRAQAWFQLYWLAFAALLVLASYALYRRGTVVELRPRLGQARRRLRGAALVFGLVAAAIFVGSGAYIYYNTNILNEYTTAPERDALVAEAEKTLLSFEKVPQPRIVTVSLDVALFPREARALTKGRYVLENRTKEPISVLHVRWLPPLTLDEVVLEGGATQKEEWPRLRYRIYELAKPMMPGEKRTLSFSTTLAEKGFPNSAPLTRIVENGTFLDNTEISPFIGMSRNDLLVDRAKRRKHGLPAELRPPKLEDEAGRDHHMLRFDSDWVKADITITTDADQIAIAPGARTSEVINGNRKTAHFEPDTLINHFFSIQSARYAVREGSAGDIRLAVYHHPAHAYNVDRMLDGMKTSLEMFGEEFSPFQFKQARILEFPSYADFAQSFANTIPYSENIGFLHRHEDPEKIDMVMYVTAHEIGHQWWAHQIISSDQQGATMLVESFAQYSALLVMEKTYGREGMRKFLKYELDRYLRSRGSEVLEELPLARVENQPYIHYNKGSLVMYWLKEVLGKEVVNRSLRAFLKQYAFQAAPYPNTLDFLRHLRREAGPLHDALITDLFEKITLVDVKTTSAKSTRRADGKWDVVLEIDARKVYADGQGNETEAPLNELFDIGVFSAEPGKNDFSPKSVLFFERRPLQTGKQTITVTVAEEPKHAGADPYNARIDRNSEDNVVAVEAGGPT